MYQESRGIEFNDVIHNYDEYVQERRQDEDDRTIVYTIRTG